jgi:hypothetical protein
MSVTTSSIENHMGGIVARIGDDVSGYDVLQKSHM